MINKMRMNRLINNISNRSVFVALDHGFTYGAIEGLHNIAKKIQELTEIKPEAYIVHKGQISHLQNIDLHGSGVIIQLTASSVICSNVMNKELVCQVEEALILGADGVAFQLNIGNIYDMQQIVKLSMVVRECQQYNIPLLVMLYFSDSNESAICHGIRMCEELGVDFIKISSVSNIESLNRIVQSSQVRVLVAGGEKNENYMDFISLLSSINIDGVVIGRNIFQHEKSDEVLKYTYNRIHKINT